jgi:hypothetical protein
LCGLFGSGYAETCADREDGYPKRFHVLALS